MKRICTRFNKPNVITSSSVAIAVDALWVILNEKYLKEYLKFHTPFWRKIKLQIIELKLTIYFASFLIKMTHCGIHVLNYTQLWNNVRTVSTFCRARNSVAFHMDLPTYFCRLATYLYYIMCWDGAKISKLWAEFDLGNNNWTLN